MLKRLYRSAPVQNALGRLLAGYLRLVRATTRWEEVPAAPGRYAMTHAPFIAAMWHGQHFMVPYLKTPDMRCATLISRHGDGEVNAIAAAQFGIGLVRGSGGHGDPAKIRKRGGVQALRAMLQNLQDGVSMVITADVPKVAGVAGEGIITLARMSGRPILPVAVVVRNHIALGSWDRAVIPLPFGRGAMIVGDPIHVPPDADAQEIDIKRRTLQDALDAAHTRAYALCGGRWRRARA